MANTYDVHLENPDTPTDGPHWLVKGDALVEHDLSTTPIAASTVPVGCFVRRNKDVPFMKVLAVTDTGE